MASDFIRPKILDCTFRDGGYYVDWDFEEETVRKYLAAIGTAKVDIIEIGFRFFPQNKFLGPFAYTTDEYLKTLPLPEGVGIAVMVNAAELIRHKQGPEQAVRSLFRSKSESPVDIVRIAAHAKDVTACHDIANMLDALGYQVFLNLMQVDALSVAELAELAQKVEHWGTVETLYFADSFGNMDPETVITTVEVISSVWSGPIGIHTHDNKGQALSNSVAALKCGIQYLDSTLLGMGRGAGNARTENLLVELGQRGYDQYFPDAVFPLVMQEFKRLQDRYRWGQNIYYYLSAVHGIHPTYVQEMLGGERYNTEQILSAINFLKSSRAPFYSFEKMLRAVAGVVGSEHGQWSATGWARDRSVLILGAGPSTKRYIAALSQFVERYNPLVLCLNVNESVPRKMVDAYVACHDMRILIEADSYLDLGKPVILPMSRVPDGIREALKNIEIHDYGLRIEENKFLVEHNGCVLGNPLALAYAISIATAGGAKQILLTGIDGYAHSDPRQQEMADVFEMYRETPSALPMIALTPTSYPVMQQSIFEPNLQV